jgi:hypothetical protein
MSSKRDHVTFNTHYEDLRLKSESAKISDPPKEMVARLAAHNIVFREKAYTNGNESTWRFAVNEHNSPRGFDFPVPAGSSEKTIIAAAYKAAVTVDDSVSINGKKQIRVLSDMRYLLR